RAAFRDGLRHDSVVDPVESEQRDAIADPDALCEERVGEPIGTPVELRVRELETVHDQGDLLRITDGVEPREISDDAHRGDQRSARARTALAVAMSSPPVLAPAGAALRGAAFAGPGPSAAVPPWVGAATSSASANNSFLPARTMRPRER